MRSTLLRVLIEGIFVFTALQKSGNFLTLSDEIYELISRDVVHFRLFVHLANQFDSITYLDFLAILILTFL